MNSDGSGQKQLTDAPNFSENPNWSPDGQWLVFVSDREQKDSRKLYVMSADGGTATRLIDQPYYAYQMVPDWQPAQSKDPCTIRGTIHNDSIVGSPAAEVICGLGGNDRLDGRAGHDTLRGGGGRDCFFARDGARDTVEGGPGRDYALVDPALDKLVGVEKSYAKWPKRRPCY